MISSGMNGTFSKARRRKTDQAVLTGSAPVSEMRGYQKEFAAYTGGFGSECPAC